MTLGTPAAEQTVLRKNGYGRRCKQSIHYFNQKSLVFVILIISGIKE
jgi:hypothetical protein